MSLNHLTNTAQGISDEFEIQCDSLKYVNTGIQFTNENLVIQGNLPIGVVQPIKIYSANVTSVNGSDGFFNWSWGDPDPGAPSANIVCYLSWSYPFVNTGTYWVIINAASNGYTWCLKKQNGSSCQIALNILNTGSILKAVAFDVQLFGY
jgi:hypothetical protein